MIKFSGIFLEFSLLVLVFSHLFASDWEVVGEMPIPVKGAQAIVHDSQIYIIGGYSDSTFSPINKIQVYNPDLNSWLVIEDTLTLSRYGHIALNDNDKALIFGGSNTEDSLNKSLEQWDFVTSPVITSFDQVFNRQFSTAQIYNNMLYIFGGYSTEIIDDTLGMNYLVVYNLNADSVEYRNRENFTTDNIPIHQMSVLIGYNIYIFGGASSGVYKDIYSFDIFGQSLTKSEGSLLNERAGGGAIVINEGTVALVGGYNEENQPMASVELLRVSDDYIIEQKNMESLNYARAEPAVVFKDSFIYTFGGRDSFGNCIPYVEKVYIEPATTVIKDQYNTNHPSHFNLSQNYPNPFNPTTTIAVDNKRFMHIKLDIYAVDGTHIKSLLNANLPSGHYNFTWNGFDNNNRPVSSGIYFYRLDNGTESIAKRMILMR